MKRLLFLLGGATVLLIGLLHVDQPLEAQLSGGVQLNVANTWTAAQSFSPSAKFLGSSSGTVTLQAAAAAGTWSLTLPTSGGTSGYYLQTNGSGVTTWAAVSSGGCALVYTAKTANYTLVANDLMAATSGTFTATLPAASSNANGCAAVVNNGTGTITVATTGGDTVALGTTDTLNPRVSASIQGDSAVYWSDGVSNWNKM